MSSRQYKVISAAVGASAAIAMSVFGVAVQHRQLRAGAFHAQSGDGAVRHHGADGHGDQGALGAGDKSCQAVGHRACAAAARGAGTARLASQAEAKFSVSASMMGRHTGSGRS